MHIICIRIILIHIFCFICFQIQAIATPLTSVKISLDWLLNPHHAPLVIGIEKGFFQEQGLNVELIGSVGSLEGCKQVAARNVDFAIIVEPQWMIQTSRGLNLKPICTLIPKPLEAFVSRVPLSELKGKRIGHCSSGIGFSIAALKEILSRQNIKLEEVKLVYTRQALSASFLSDQVDAVTNLYRLYEVSDLRNYTSDFYVYPFEEVGIPTFAAMILVSRPDLPQNIEEKLFKALEKACAFLKHHPDESWKLFIKHKPEMDTPVNAQVWNDVIQLFEIKKVETNGSHHQALKEFLEKHKLI
jgi:putative hydroxymethylpyrimidine transport system substrate-binding protein